MTAEIKVGGKVVATAQVGCGKCNCVLFCEKSDSSSHCTCGHVRSEHKNTIK